MEIVVDLKRPRGCHAEEYGACTRNLKCCMSCQSGTPVFERPAVLDDDCCTRWPSSTSRLSGCTLSTLPKWTKGFLKVDESSTAPTMSPTSGATLSSSSSSARRHLFEEVVVATGAGAAAVVTSKAVATRSDVSATARVTLSAELRRSYVLLCSREECLIANATSASKSSDGRLRDVKRSVTNEERRALLDIATLASCLKMDWMYFVHESDVPNGSPRLFCMKRLMHHYCYYLYMYSMHACMHACRFRLPETASRLCLDGRCLSVRRLCPDIQNPPVDPVQLW
eukprot:Em0059g23a